MKCAPVLLALLLALVTPAWTEPLPGLRAIQQRGRLLVAQYRGEARPYFSGSPRMGIDVTLAQEIADGLGVKLELRPTCSDFDDVCRAVAAGEADLGLSALSISPQRAQIVRFSHPYAAFPSELLLNRLQATRRGLLPDPDLGRLRSLPDLTLALSTGTAAVSQARTLFPGARVTGVPVGTDPAAYILQHDLLGTLSNGLDAAVRFADNEDYALYLQRFQLPTVDHMGVALAADNPDLLGFVNAVVDSHPLLSDSQQVLDSYLPADPPGGPESAPRRQPLPVLAVGLLVLALTAIWLLLARPDPRPPLPGRPESLRVERPAVEAPSGPLEWLKNPWVCLAAALAGTALGLLQPAVALQLQVVGNLFLNLLALSVLPIIVCAIIVSISEALRGPQIGRYLSRTLLVFVVGALLASAVGAFLGAVALEFFSPSEGTLETLGRVLQTQKVPTLSSQIDPEDMLKAIVPPNVFETFSSGHLLGMVLVSVLLGTALGLMPKGAGQTLEALVKETHLAFLQILDWSIYLSPLGFASLIAASVAHLGPEVILSLSEILVVQYLGVLLLCLLYLVAISRSTGVGLLRTLRLLRQSMTVAVVTMDPIPAIPLAMEEMSGPLQQPRRVGNFVIPLSVILSGHNLSFQLSVMAVFVAHIFGVQASLAGVLAMIALAAFPGSLAGPSMPTLIAMVPFVLGPLALPVAPGMALMLLTSSLNAPICGLHGLLAAVANSAIVSRTRVTES